jgi:hypothetical protein
VRLTYGAHERIVEPHLHGFTSEGREVVLGWQLEGGSASNDPQPWRLFQIDRIATLEVLAEGFGARQTFSTASREVRTVHCAVETGYSRVNDTPVT